LISKAVTWPQDAYNGQIVAMFMGQITPDEALVRAQAVRAEDLKGSLCRTNFYAGELFLIKGDKASAKKHFDAAIATGGVAYPEYAMSLAELKGL
jgi:lipoprotein NlpI